MTHTLHRSLAAGDVDRDWVVMALAAAGPSRVGAPARLRRFLTLARAHRPVNLGDMRTGSALMMEPEAIAAGIDEASVVHAVFDDDRAVAALLRDLVAAGLGLSVVVTGPLALTQRCCRSIQLEPHTVALSLGVRGRRDRLPAPRVLEITTQCGHGAIAATLVEDTVVAVACGRLSLEDGVQRLGRQCVCGVFNPVVAGAALARLVRRQRHRRSDGAGASPSDNDS